MGSLKYWISTNIILISTVILIDINVNAGHRFEGNKILFTSLISIAVIIIFIVKIISDKKKGKCKR